MRRFPFDTGRHGNWHARKFGSNLAFRVLYNELERATKRYHKGITRPIVKPATPTPRKEKRKAA